MKRPAAPSAVVAKKPRQDDVGAPNELNAYAGYVLSEPNELIDRIAVDGAMPPLRFFR